MTTEAAEVITSSDIPQFLTLTSCVCAQVTLYERSFSNTATSPLRVIALTVSAWNFPPPPSLPAPHLLLVSKASLECHLTSKVHSDHCL